MTLQSYLSSGAVEDVKTAIEMGLKSSWDLSDIGKPGVEIEFAPDGAWTLVMVSVGTESEVCYYREQSGSYIVSDCGETVSEVMRRTGKTWRQAFDFAWGCLDLAPRIQGRMGGDIWIDTDSASDLPAAIVSVLGAVAKVRAGLDKEQGQ